MTLKTNLSPIKLQLMKPFWMSTCFYEVGTLRVHIDAGGANNRTFFHHHISQIPFPSGEQ